MKSANGRRLAAPERADTPDARAGVQYYQLPVRPHFHARCVAAIMDGGRPGGGQRAAHAPETDRRRPGRDRSGAGRGGRTGAFFGGPRQEDGSVAAAAELFQQPVQVLLQNRFDQIFVGPGFDRPVPVHPVTAAGGQDKQGAGMRPRPGPQKTAELETVAAGGQLIAEDQVRFVGQGQVAARLPVGGFDHRQPGLAQPPGKRFTNHPVLIYKQGGLHARGAGAPRHPRSTAMGCARRD